MTGKVASSLAFGGDAVRALAVGCADGSEITSAVSRHPRRPDGRHSNRLASQRRHHRLYYIERMTISVLVASVGVSDLKREAIVGPGDDTAIFTIGRRPEHV